MKPSSIVALVALLIACGAGANTPPPFAADSGATALAANTARASARGTRFIAPNGWSVTAPDAVMLLGLPEPGARVAIVESAATEAGAAVRDAWAAAGMTHRWPLKLATDRPAQDGWDAIRRYDYELGANDLRWVQARAFRANGRWTVALMDVPEAVAEKRLAQFNVLFDRFEPAGYQRESFAGRKPQPLDAARVAALVDFVRDAQRKLEIPGASIGLVQDGRVVFADGVGVRELGRPEPVDADTLYIVASNTKAMTTLMLARLVEQGRFGWDTPVVQLMPRFALGDAATSRRVQVQHLVCACTGLPRRDTEWIMEFKGADAAATLDSLATMQPTSEFGDLFQYSNPLASAGGYVGAHVLFPRMELGAAYDRAMQEQVFDPLGMASTTFDFSRALATDHASPHAFDGDGVTRVAPMDFNYAIVPVRPAGGAWSNVRDMLRYVQMELDRGRLPDGRRYIGEALLGARLEEKVSEGVDSSYGMGLATDRRWGVRVVNHGGSMLGYKSDMLWLPDHGVGAVILTNADNGGYLLQPFQRRLLELLFDGESLAAAQVDGAAARMKAFAEAERKRVTVPAAEAVVAKLAPRYRHPALGMLEVRREGGRTLLDLGEWRSEVATRAEEGGAEVLRMTAPGLVFFEFVLGRNANGRTLVTCDSQHEYVFEEVR